MRRYVRAVRWTAALDRAHAGVRVPRRRTPVDTRARGVCCATVVMLAMFVAGFPGVAAGAPGRWRLDVEGTLAAEALVRLHSTLSSPVSCRTGAETLHTRGFSCADAYRRAQRALHLWERLSNRANRPVTAFTSGGLRWRQSYKHLPGCCEAQILRLHGVQGTRLIDYELSQSQ
jgi:hypothetical protein